MTLGDLINPTLTATGKTFWSSSSSILTLYNCDTEVIQKDAGLIFASMPILTGTTTGEEPTNYDSNYSIAGDLLGNTRNIQLQGRFTTNEISAVYKFVRDLVSIGSVNAATLLYAQGDARGAGKPGYTYTPACSNLSSTGALTGTLQETINVYVKTASVTFKAGEPNFVDYSISLGECSPTYSL